MTPRDAGLRALLLAASLGTLPLVTGVARPPDGAREGSAGAAGAARASAGPDTVTARVDSLERQGRFAEAIALAERAWGTPGHPGSPTLEQQLVLGRLQLAQGALAEAIEAFRRGLARLERDANATPEARARVLNLLARAEKNRGMYAEADTHYRQAIGLARAAGVAGRREHARALAGMANLIRRNSLELPRAAGLLRESVRLHDAIGPSAVDDAADARTDLALVLLMLGRAREAEAPLRWALRVRERALGPEHPDLGLLRSLRGWLLYREGDYARAEVELRRAMTLVAAARERSTPGRNRRAYAQRVAVNLAATLLELGRGDEAWAALDEGLSGYLLDRLFGHPEAGAVPPAEHAIRSVQRELGARTAVVGWLEASLVNETPAALWAYVLRDRGRVCWVRLPVLPPSPGGDARGRKFAVARLLERDGSWPARVTQTLDLETAAHRVYEERMGPLEPLLRGVERLIVVDAGELAQCPVEVMRDDRGRYLGERFETSYVPSSAAFVRLRGRATARAIAGPAGMLVVGESVAAASTRDHRGFAALPSVDAEVASVAATHPGALLLRGAQASERAVDSLVRNAAFGARLRVLHLAAHGMRDVRLPGAGALVLAGSVGSPEARNVGATLAVESATTGDGLLTSAEVEDWQLRTDLVTLSGCGTSGFRGFGSAPGLAESFLIAGSSQVVVSVWSVDDRATALLMSRFYASLAHPRATGGASAAAALKEARLWLREQQDESGRRPYANPAYWAGFVVVGAEGR